MNGVAISALRASPVLVVDRYDLKRRELVLRVDRCTGPAVSALLGRAYPCHDVTVMAADDTLDVLDALQDSAAVEAPQLFPPSDRAACAVHFNPQYGRGTGDLAYTVSGPHGEVTAYYRRAPEVRKFDQKTNPGGRWWAHMTFIDRDGRSWHTSTDDMITDDFGQLVEVPA